MGKKTKLVFQGQIVEAELIPVRSSQEGWSEYILEDGTVLRMKLVVTDVYRLEGIYDSDGNPIYHIKSTNAASAIPPENLKRLPGK